MQTAPTVSVVDTSHRRSRWLRRVALCVFVLVPVLLLTTPYAVSLSFVRERLARNLSEKLGVDAHVDGLSFGWSYGITATNVHLGNPPGFDRSRPLLRVDELHADASLLALLRGQPDIRVAVRGLQVCVDQESGGINIVALQSSAATSQDQTNATNGIPPSHGTDPQLDIAAWGIAFALHDAVIEVRQDRAVVETLRGLQCSVRKELHSSKVEITLDTQLAALPDRPAGDAHFQCTADAITRAGTVALRTSGLDLARLRPLLTSTLGEAALTECRGLIAGDLTLETTGGTAPRLQLAGSMAVTDLHLAGEALSGVDLQARECQLRPALRLDAASARDGGFHVDLPLGGATPVALGLQPSSLTAQLTGLRLLCDAQRMGRRAADPTDPSTAAGQIGTAAVLTAWHDLPLQLDVGLADAQVELRRGNAVVESLTSLRCRLQKQPSTPIQLTLDTQLAALPDRPAGDAQLTASIDLRSSSVDASLSTTGLELTRLRPFLDASLAPGDLSALAGRLSGTCRAQIQDFASPAVQIDGQLVIANALARGALLQGMELRGERWTLTPKLRTSLASASAGKLPQLSEGFAIDLGCVSLRATEATGRDAVAVAFAADLATLASFGGPIPAELRGTGATARGTATLPLRDGQLPPLAELPSLLIAQVDVGCGPLEASGFHLRDFLATAALQEGQLHVQSKPGSTLNQGPLQINLQADLRDPSTAVGELALHWQDGKVQGETAHVLSRFIPLLAGGQDDSARFDGKAGLQLALRGPLQKPATETWLAFANRWSGTGSVSLDQATVTPAPGLQGLMQPLGALIGPTVTLGANGKLLLDAFGGTFALERGGIEARTMRWLSKGKSLGLSGRIGLDGALGVGIDLRPLLQEHKDGKRVLQLLGEQPVEARLLGSLDNPSLRLPDLGKVLQNAITNPSEALQKQAEQLLRKGVFDLLNGRKEQSPKK